MHRMNRLVRRGAALLWRERIVYGLVCVLGALADMPVAADAQQDVAGVWHGVLDAPVGKLTLVFTIEKNEDGTLRASMESPDQAPGRQIPVASVAVSGNRLTMAIPAIGGRYEGVWSASTRRWEGTFSQGMDVPLVLERGAPAARAVVTGMDGVWEGRVTRNGVDLRLIVRVRTDERGTTVTFDAPDMAATGIPVSGFARTGDAIVFKIPASGARYEGTLAGENRMSGTWTLPGQAAATVVFERTRMDAEPEPRVRPQTPKPPFPYRSEDVVFENAAAAGATLAGTLTLPPGGGPFAAAILISGSGPQDRDETIRGHKPFAVLADHLTRSGIAVLRYDDRGVGASTGDFAAATSADFATDASAAVRYLRTRIEIDHDAIGFIGHSEGAMIGPIAAAGNDGVAFLVLLAGPGTTTVELLRTQRRLMGLSQGAAQEELDRADPVFVTVVEAVLAARDEAEAETRVRALLTADALEALGAQEESRELAVRQFTSPWFRWFIRYDPAQVLSRIDVPVLALNGTLDVQVPADANLAGIAAALAHNPDVTIRRLAGLNHLFQTARTGALGEYADIEETFAPQAMGIIVAWLHERFGG